MRWIICGFVILSPGVTAAQTPPPPRPLPAVIQASGREVEPAKPAVDLQQLPPHARQAYLSAQRGAEWLVRAQQPDGRFFPGWNVALGKPTTAGSPTDSIEATRALAAAASFFRDERYAVRARQAVLTLLLETTTDPADPRSRYTALPSNVVNRVGASAGLALAIIELPSPDAELLERAEQLVRFLVHRQSADGSFQVTDQPGEAVPPHAGRWAAIALSAICRSHAAKPAEWKAEAVRKALGFYHPQWCQSVGAPAEEAAFATALAHAGRFGADRAKSAADAAALLADRIVARQFDETETRSPEYRGGFRNGTDAPRIDAAAHVTALTAAAGLMRQVPDAARHARYRAAAERGAQFLTTLQYNESRCQHFAANYRPLILGGCHGSPCDGDITTGGTALAVRALIDTLR